MRIGSAIRGVARRTTELPGVRHALKALYERRFVREKPRTNLYRGVFPTFADALANVPSSRPLGYDHAATAAMYRDRTRRVYISDYPLLFWMRTLFESGCASVFDLGGHIGIGYYAYQRYLRYPPALRWLVHDVPAVITSGREWADQNDPERRLAFTSRREDAEGMDLLFASGSLQYLDYTLADLLAPMARRPAHLLINLLPVHMSLSYFTVQNMGAAYCPYRISAEPAFLGGLRELGYVLKDRWENPDRRCEIPHHRGYSLDRYFGYYLARQE